MQSTLCHHNKSSINSMPVLRFPDFTFPFFIHADPCDAGLGARLMQRDDDGRDVDMAYAIRALHKSENPHSTPEKECLAIMLALEHLRSYVEGLHGTIFTKTFSCNGHSHGSSACVCCDQKPGSGCSIPGDVNRLSTCATTSELLRQLEDSHQNEENSHDPLQYAVQNGLLYFHDPKA